jgi:tetratricopeptide (TPR) repeat protein
MELAFCYANQKEYAKAMEMMDQCMEHPCELSDMTVIRGHLQLECGMVKEAEESFKKAIMLSDNAPSILLRIIVSLFDNHYISSSYEMFKKFFQVVNKSSVEYVKGYSYMALCCHDLGKYDEFMEYLKKAVQLNPRETKLILGSLFPEAMEPSEYVGYMEHRFKKETE